MDGSIRVALVAGGAPNGTCGVADYTSRLSGSLASLGLDAPPARVRFAARPGTTAGLAGTGGGSSLDAFDVVHVQYPSLAFGVGPLPLIVAAAAGRPVVVTLHEFSRAHPLRRALMATLARLADRVVFTSAFERERAGSWARSAPVIPIASNIEVCGGVPTRSTAGRDTVLFFGLHAPGKGLDEFLALVAQRRARGDERRFVVLGDAVGEAFGREARARTEAAGAQWLGRAPVELVSAELGRARAAYLPYPDGASERRATLLAALAHGVPVVSTPGEAVTTELAAVVALAATVRDADAQLSALDDDRRWAACSRRGLDYAAARSWAAVAGAHRELYGSLVGVRRRRRRLMRPLAAVVPLVVDRALPVGS